MKQCTACGELKEETQFYKCNRWPDGLQKQCKDCHKTVNKKHYSANKDAYMSRSTAQRKEITEWWKEYKRDLTCQVCGESRWWCLDFHHTDPTTKDMAVSAMVSNIKNKETILEEIAKCVVVCRNCHADIHYQKNYGSMV